MSRINKWIDTGISIELMYNLNRNIKAVDVFETIMDAWKKGLKTLYYTRTIQKDVSSATAYKGTREKYTALQAGSAAHSRAIHFQL